MSTSRQPTAIPPYRAHTWCARLLYPSIHLWILHLRCQGVEATRARQRDALIGTTEQASGPPGEATPFLRRCCVHDDGHPTVALLHPKPLLQHVFVEDAGCGGARGARQKSAGCAAGRGTRPPAQPTRSKFKTRYSDYTGPTVPTIASRFTLMAYTNPRRGTRPRAGTPGSRHALRRSRCGLRRHAGTRSVGRFAGFVGGSRLLHGSRSRAVNHFEGISIGTSVARAALCRLRQSPGIAPTIVARGQHGRLLHTQHHDIGVEADDGGAASPTSHDAGNGRTDRSALVAVRGDQIRRRSLPDVGPGRRSSDDAVAQIDTRRASAGLRGFCVPSSGRDVSGPTQISDHADAGTLRRRQITTLEPSVRLASAFGAENNSEWWHGCPGSSPLASSSLACVIGGSRHQLRSPPTERRRLFSTAQYEKGLRRLVRRSCNDGVKPAWQEGIRDALLSKCRSDGATGCAQAAADLLADFGWSTGTWMNRSSHIKKWFAFCEEDGRPKVGSSEGDDLAYIGFLHLEWRVGPTSISQYVTAVSRYHELLHAKSPTHTPLVSALVKAYANNSDLTGHVKTARIGLSADVFQRVVAYGLATDYVAEVGFCATVVFAFVFQCRSVSVAHVKDTDITITPLVVTTPLTHRKVPSSIFVHCVCLCQLTTRGPHQTHQTLCYGSGNLSDPPI